MDTTKLNNSDWASFLSTNGGNVTSPSQLQEVTLDSNASANGTIPFTMGIRSPGKSSPIRGRTMKEYEELSQLKKENFNLKLRIYFLEERMGHMNSQDDKEDPVKKNIELKVEAESLRKEVSDKQELLCQAAKAMDLLEEQHRGEMKKMQEERDVEREMLECKLSELENELKGSQARAKEQNFTKVGDNTLCEAFGLNVTRCIDHHSREEVENLQQQIEELESQVQQLENTLQEEVVRSSQLEEELQEAQQEAERVCVRCQGLELELKQRDGKLEDLLQELEQKGQDLAGSNLRIRTLEEALSAKEPEIQIKVQELCERDRIIEEKQNQIEQQNKVLVEIQITLDEKQRQIDSLRSSLAARDSTIADIEGRLAKAKAYARNLEAKLDASIHEANRLREEVETLKAQQKRSTRNRDQIQHDLDSIGPLRRRSSNISNVSAVTNASDEKVSPGRRIRPIPEDDSSLRKRLLELKEKEEKLRVMEQNQKETKVQLDQAREIIKSMEEKVRVLETICQDTKNKLKDSEKKVKENDGKTKQLENEHSKACQALKSFMKRQKEMAREVDQFKSDAKKKDRRIHEQTLEVNELRDALNKASWEARQFQAQARVHGGGGIPGALEDVRDMTEEENERLWAEVEDKNKKLAQLTKERDSVSLEMEKQVQVLIKTLKEKEELLADYETKASTSLNELEARDNRIKELEDDMKKLESELNSLNAMGSKVEGMVDGELRLKEISDINDNKTSLHFESLAVELENKKREVERLNLELQKRTNNLQELVNKELWDKNREIEKLQDRLSNVCERKELEIMSLQQQIGARDFQLKMLQDKVTELGMHVNLPTSLMFRELQQIPVTFNQHVHYSQPSTANDVMRPDSNDVPIGEVSSTISPSKGEESSLQDQLQASIEDRKYLCRKVDELREKLRNTPERDSDSRTLRSECIKLREEIDRANAWRKEAGEAYALVTKRLEELAGFLSSLLRHPEQLGSLGAKRRQLLKQAVERNVELSRSLSVSFSVSSQDFSNTTFAPLLDSFSSLLMSTTDLNLSITDIMRIDEADEEVSGCDYPGLQEVQIETGSNYCRSSGSNSEIAQILGMKDSSTSEDIFSPTEKIVQEQAQVIAQLRSQIEILTQEIKQRDIEFSKSQNEELLFGKPETCVNLSGPRSGSTSPSKSSSASSGTVRKSRIEGDRLENVEEAEESLNSMVFYNSHHLSTGNLKKHESCIPIEKHVLSDSKVLQGVTLQEKFCVEAQRSVSSPMKSYIPSEDVSTQLTFGDTTKTTPKKQDQIKSIKSAANYKMYRSSSASAVALNQLQQPVQTHEIPPGSHSESEAWSEPDRTVSLARIGLNEESTKSTALVLGGVNGCAPISSTRSRNGRVLQDDDDSSESSKQTAHEIRIHGTGKRVRNDAGEIRRFQNRLRALEQVNEALRAELTILHQLTPPHSLPSTTAERCDKPATRDMSINTTQFASEEKLDKSTSIESIQDQVGNTSSSVTIPVHLLEQIRYQREKLESSLFHNDFIRRQLEGIISSISNQDGDNMMNLWQKMKETTEQLEEAQHQSQELECKLQEMEAQFEESKRQARLADAANEQLQVTRETVCLLQEQVTTLEARLQEKDNEILERKCQLLELENQAKQQSIEAENVMQEAKKVKEEAEIQLKAAEIMKYTEENKMKDAEKIITEAEKMKSDANDRMIELEKRLKDVELQLQDVEMQKSKLQSEKDIIQREKERLLKDKEITQNERESIKIEKETNDKERIKIEEEWEKLKKEKEAMKKEIDELMKEVQVLTENANKQKDDAEKQMKEAKRKIEEAELQKEEAEWKIRNAEEEIILIKKQYEVALKEQTKELEIKLNEKLHETEKKLEQQEWVNKSEVQKKIREAERLGLEFAVGLKSQIEDAQKQEREIREETERKIKNIEERSKEREAELQRCLQESEKCCREKECELNKHCDESRLTNSQAVLEQVRLANEKLHLEQEIRHHVEREAELIHERKEAENRLLISKEQLEKEMEILQQQKNDLEKCVKELETANRELRRRIRSLHIKEQLSTSSVHTEQSSGHTSGPDSTTSLTYVKHGGTSPGSYSSGLDLLTGEGGSLSNSPWGTTGPVSLECVGSQNEEKEHCRESSRRGSDGGYNGGLTALSSMVLQHGFGRQRSELSDYMSEDQAQEYEAVITQTCSSSYWVTTLTEQHSTPSGSVPVDPSSMRNINSSPDLGIESDQGRFSSLEAASSGMQVDTSKVVSTMEGYGSDMDRTLAPIVINSRGDAFVRSYKELEQENIVLRRRLTRTHRVLEETQTQLMAANQRKKQVERAICKQLHKTHHILKKAKINLNAGTDYISPSTEELE